MIYNDSIILTEADADEFLESARMDLYENSLSINENIFDGIKGQEILESNGILLCEDCIILEGEQAEEYLRKKKEVKNKEKESIENDRHGHDFINNYGNKGFTAGPRSAMRPRHDKESIDDYYKHFSRRDHTGYYPHRTPSHVERDPKYATARGLEEKRTRYSDVMPSRKTPSELELNKAREKEAKEVAYGDKVAKNHIKLDTSDSYGYSHGNAYKSNYKYAVAADAARRHYRKTHKHEATDIFSSIKFI